MNTNFIFGQDPLLSDPRYQNIQQRYAEELAALQQAKAQVPQPQPQPQQQLVWDKIDEELSTLSDMQKQELFEDAEYREAEGQLQVFVQREIMAIIKPKIEANKDGKELLEAHLARVKKLKKIVIDKTNKKIDELSAFEKFAMANPNATYQDFINSKK